MHFGLNLKVSSEFQHLTNTLILFNQHFVENTEQNEQLHGQNLISFAWELSLLDSAPSNCVTKSGSQALPQNAANLLFF